jgi:phosphatidate cytidylyltransferase
VDRNLQLRILTALSLGLGFIAAIYFSVYATIALFAAILILGLFELFKIIRACDTQIKPNRILTIWLAFVVYGMLAVLPGFLRLDMLFPRDFFLALGLLFVSIFVLFVAELFRNQTKPLENLAFSMFGIAYLAIPMGLIVSASFDSEGNYQPWYILFFFFFMWASDTGAYFAGRFFGKRKLFERLSPKKTIEGFIGGMLASGLLGWAAHSHLGKFGLIEWIGIGVLLSITGTAGDLFESMLKRQAGVKDSGNILPGHGGILDRFDSALLSAPVYWILLYLGAS